MDKAYLLVEDDCAPDARETFEREFLKIIKLTLEQFKDKAIKTTRDNNYFVEYRLYGYLLEISADFPHYMLSKEDCKCTNFKVFGKLFRCEDCGKMYSKLSAEILNL